MKPITEKKLEEFRKKGCFCDELDVDFCSKCNSPIEEQRPCMLCNFVNDLKGFMKSTDKTGGDSR